MKNDRRPEYHKKDHDLRIVSRANERWAVQRRIADRGTRDRDCWGDLMGASKLSYEAAVARMNNEGPQR